MTVAAVIQRARAGFTPYGGAARFMYCHEPEVIIGGPYDTGKTITALNRLHLLLCKHAGARALMVRKTYQSLIQTAVVTYERKVLPAPPDTPEPRRACITAGAADLAPLSSCPYRMARR